MTFEDDRRRSLKSLAFRQLCFTLWVMPRKQVYLLLFITLTSCEARSVPRTDAPAAPPSAIASTSFYRHVRHSAANWITFELDLDKIDLLLVGQAPNDPHTFTTLGPFLEAQNREMVLSTNAGIFHPSRMPVGLHIQRGKEFSPLSTADGEGNFFLKPNGVFWIDAHGPHVAPTESYSPQGAVELATQSGPLLTNQGQIHKAFAASSTSLRTRSGIGVNTKGKIVVALSENRVTFYGTATLFRDILDCPNALYLDGEISAVVAPGLPTPEIREYGGLLVAVKKVGK
jgi:uncharacterized protein YigE (DUF2233 family)